MIGQINLLQYFQDITKAGKLPRFIILVGSSGSGKSLLAATIATEFIKCPLAVVDLSVEGIRVLINDAYKVEQPVCYFLRDADEMSSAAKNALLKVTEEPPNNAYFIMSLENKENMLQTILSRAQAYNMEPYSAQELREYYNQYKAFKGIEVNVDPEQVSGICETPGDIESFVDNSPEQLLEFSKTAVEYIGKVSGANALKMASRISLKGEAGFDLKLFWRLFTEYCFSLNNGCPDTRYLEAIKVTSSYLQNLRLKGINRAMLFDTWIFDVRGVLK